MIKINLKNCKTKLDLKRIKEAHTKEKYFDTFLQKAG